MNWIKIRTDLVNDPAVLMLAGKMKCSRHQIVGQLSDIWGWVGGHTSDGSCPNITLDMIDAYIQAPGFSTVLCEIGWLEQSGQGVIFPKWDRHNSSSAKARAMEAEAKRLRRQLVGQVSDKSESKRPTREEKRREENDIAPPIGDAAGDGASKGVKDDPQTSGKGSEGQKKERPRNPLFDALAKVTGSDATRLTKAEGGRIAAALADIRRACPELTEQDIRRAAQGYRQLYPDPAVACTPTALAANWSKCWRPAKKENGGAGPVPEIIQPPEDWRERWAACMPGLTCPPDFHALPAATKRTLLELVIA